MSAEWELTKSGSVEVGEGCWVVEDAILEALYFIVASAGRPQISAAGE